MQLITIWKTKLVKAEDVAVRWTLVQDDDREFYSRQWTSSTRRTRCARDVFHRLTWIGEFTKSLYDDDLAILRVRSEPDNERISWLDELRLDYWQHDPDHTDTKTISYVY